MATTDKLAQIGLLEDLEADVPQVLHGLDNSLSCRICGDHYRSAVTIADPKCGHSFCSECIRSAFSRQMTKTTSRVRRCPICNSSFKDESILVKNFALQEAVAAYKATVPLVKRELESKSPRTSDHESVPEEAVGPGVRSSRRLQASGKLASNDDKPEETASTGARAARISMDSSDAKSVKEAITTKKAKPNYARKTRKQLQELCRQEGIRTDGNEEQLKKRHQEWIVLYNSETDAIEPRSAHALRYEFSKREAECNKARWKDASKSATANAMAALIKSRPNDNEATPGRKLTTGNPDLDRQINNGFKAMIAKVRAKKQPTTKVESPTAEATEEQVSSLNANPVPSIHMESGATAELESSVEVPEKEDKKVISISQPSVAEQLVDLVSDNESSSHSSEPSASVTPNSVAASQPKMPFPVLTGLRRTRLCDKDSSSRPSQKQRISVIGAWECHRCTFYNERNIYPGSECEMKCGTSRPKP